MPDTFRSIASDLRRDLGIREVTSTIVDVPTVRQHKLSPDLGHGAELCHRASSGWPTAPRASARRRRSAARAGARRASRP